MGVLEDNARALRAFIEKSVQCQPDEDALEFACLHPTWTPGMKAVEGYRYQYEDRLWKCLTAHITQENWRPGTDTASLWEEVNEAQAGSIDDPIPYDGNMALEAGKYYSQDGVVYLCTRDTGIAVYHALADLIGLYVAAAEI